MRTILDKSISFVLIVLMTLMTLDVLWGVFTRYALSHQASWTEELARFLLIWIGILGSAYAVGQHKHLAIDLLGRKLNPTNRKKLNLAILGIVSLFVIGVMLIGGTRLIHLTFRLGQTSPALQLPMGLVYSVIPLSGLLILLYHWDDFRTMKRRT